MPEAGIVGKWHHLWQREPALSEPVMRRENDCSGGSIHAANRCPVGFERIGLSYGRLVGGGNRPGRANGREGGTGAGRAPGRAEQLDGQGNGTGRAAGRVGELPFG